MAAIHAQQRFMVSPDGGQADWFAPDAVPAGWTDCTDLDAEQLQCLIAERQAVRPHIVGIATSRHKRLTLASFDQLQHDEQREREERRAEVERRARNTF